MKTKRTYLLLFAGLFLLSLSACTFFYQSDINTFWEYTCRDPHLTYLKASKICGRGYVAKSKERLYAFRTIKGEEDRGFIAGQSGYGYPLSGRDYHSVYQSPDNTISVLDDWTIREIRLYPADSGVGPPWKNTFESNDPHTLYGDAAPKEAVEEFRALVNHPVTKGENIIAFTFDEKLGQFVDAQGRISDTSDTAWCLRVFFNESDTIVWDTEASSTWDPQGIGGRWLYLELGRGTEGENNELPSDINIRLPDNSSLYQWINSTIESYTAEHPITAAETDRTQK